MFLNSMFLSTQIVRTFVYAIMITFATVTADVIYVVLRMNQENEFKQNFDFYANMIVTGFYDKLSSRLVAADSLSTSLTLQAIDMKSPWPYVSFPEFEMRCAGTRQLALASSVTFAPLIPSDDPTTREYWESNAVLKNLSGNLESDFSDDFQVSDTDEQSVYFIDTMRLIREGIYYIVGAEAHDLPLIPVTNVSSIFPLWQRSPAIPNGTDVRMYDQMSNPIRAHALNALLSAEHPISGILTDFMIYDSNLTDYAYYTTPRTTLYTPIYESADAEVVVATLDLEFMWETFLAGILDDDVESLVVVAQSSCSGHEYSFDVSGSRSTYLGSGDLHKLSSSFEPPKPVNSTYEAFLQVLFPSSNFTASNATLDASQLPCQFRISVYSTQDFMDVYVTNMPEIYRWFILGGSLFMVSAFLIYDCIVEQRSIKVVESAKRTDALVSTLFPSNVKQRLLENADKKRQQQLEAKKKTAWQMNNRGSDMDSIISDDCDVRLPMIHTPKRRLKSFLDPGQLDLVSSGDIDDSEPIADLFPDASVMFADVAGTFGLCHGWSHPIKTNIRLGCLGLYRLHCMVFRA
jgi:hypothetical protein